MSRAAPGPFVVTRWRTPRAVPVLRQHEIHVWRVRTADWTPRVPQLELLLESAELERGARFHFAKDRDQFVVAHGLLRHLLGHYSRCAPESLRFATGPAGKPCVVSPAASSFLQFNLSHSADMMLIAVGLECALGVDVERWSDDVDPVDLAPHCFSQAERQELLSLAPDQRRPGFYSCWARKEAYIKATGLGVSQGLEYFDVVVAPDRPGRLLADRRTPENAQRWYMIDLDVGPEFSAALVVSETDRIPRYLTLAPGGLSAAAAGIA